MELYLGERDRDARIGAEGGVVPGVRGVKQQGFSWLREGGCLRQLRWVAGDGAVCRACSICGLNDE